MSGRREFIATALAALGTSSLLAAGDRHEGPGQADAGRRAATHARNGESLNASGHAALTSHPALSIQQVIDLLLADIPGAPFPQTVDTIKSGDPSWPVKGIVTTMFATDAVIEKTIQLGANFIIAHEPTFYNHTDETSWLEGDRVFRFKKDLLDKHQIVVWRFHDGWHTHRPDGIRMGVLSALGWEKYYDAAQPQVVTIPVLSLGDLIKHAKKQMAIDKVKVIGDLAQSCQRIVIMPGAGGGKAQIQSLQKYNPDCLICGELNEWETAEYIRDARYQGGKTSLLVLGHSVSEEPGMQWLIPVLQPKVPGIRITHIPSGDPFQTI
ncbi:MAG TPA: Nif3-like dinuclear metal center hexameric protein [Puia sp.]|nr:Nif3-like dinuclear metal center hexameric protein [Puia sp.]